MDNFYARELIDAVKDVAVSNENDKIVDILDELNESIMDLRVAVTQVAEKLGVIYENTK